MIEPPLSLKNQILQQCATLDRGKLLRQLKNKKTVGAVKLQENINSSKQKVVERQQQRPASNLDISLPFFTHQEELSQLIQNNQVVIICGETGSGKTTQLPQLCLDLGLADFGQIGHTQPRRIAAHSVASRIAGELKTEVGEAVGYKVRFRDHSNPQGYIKLMTDGILLAEIQHDRLLNQYSTLIIDEAHERSLNIDLLLGYIKQILPRRPDLKLIVTSATIDPERFSKYFNNAPIVNISGRGYPVEIRYRGTDGEERDEGNMLIDAIDELDQDGRGDMLIFFPGERQIRDAMDRLSKHYHRDNIILPLYSRLTHLEQQQIFKQQAHRKIVLATNVAETSLTVPGIRYVIDTGMARISRYSWRSRVQRLPIEKISRASANQRSGRCGRISAGTCIRLYDEEDFDGRDEFTEPEILRSNLASVILQMNELKLGSIHQFDFIDRPDSRLINDGYRLLFELKASDLNEHITKHGQALAKMPIDPRLAHMLLTAQSFNCVREIQIITSALAVQDPRDNRQENRQAVQQKHAAWKDKTSDFVFWLNCWNEIKSQQKELTRNQFSRWCQKNFLSYLRIREWQDIHAQIGQTIKELKLKTNKQEADLDLVHRCIFNGIPGHIASHHSDHDYQATRGRKLKIFPGSDLARKTPKWLMAFSFLETSQLFAHSVANLNPQWPMLDAVHLHQYEYYEPHWQRKQGRVAAFRNTRIYGLIIEAGKKVNFASIDPVQSRQIFIQSALVEGEYYSRTKVINENRKLLQHYQQQEDKFRRRDIVIGDEHLYEFYDQRLPPEAVDGVSFEAWVKNNPEVKRELRFLKTDVINPESETRSENDYPESIVRRGQTIALTYLFDPAQEFDGVTASIPLELLNQFEDSDFEWLVPGFLLDRVTALIKSLPRSLRKNFIPVNDFAAACVERIDSEFSLITEMTKALKAMTGIDIPDNQWKPETVDRHLTMHYRVFKGDAVITEGHSLAILQSEFGSEAKQQFDTRIQNKSGYARTDLTDWDFDQFDREISVKRGKQSIKTFPALVDYQDNVAIELFETRIEADFYHATGIARLFYCRLSDNIKYLKRNLPKIDHSGMMYLALGSQAELIEDILLSGIFDCFLRNAIPTNKLEFEKALDNNKSRFLEICMQCSDLVHEILQQWRELKPVVEQSNLADQHQQDIQLQISYLIYGGFVRDCGYNRLQRIPTIFKAIEKRISNYKPSQQIEENLELVQHFWLKHSELEQ